MAGDAIHARVTAVRDLGHGVAAYGRGVEAALQAARSDLNAISARFELAVAQSEQRWRAAQRATAQARAALARCREGCGGLAAAVARCQAAELAAQHTHERNRRARERLNRAASELLSSMRSVETSTTARVTPARRDIQAYAETLTAYLQTGVTG
jgi:hypothetical protein